MRGTTVNARRLLGVCAALLLCGSLAAGQQPVLSETKPPKGKPAEPKTLEDLLAAALKNNPDVRVAEAKVREAEAELNRSRLQVTQKVVTLYRALVAQRQVVKYSEEEQQRLRKNAQILEGRPEPDTRPDGQKVLLAKAKLSELEAELAYLTGQQPAGAAWTLTVRPDQTDLRAVYGLALSQAQAELAVAEAMKAPASKPQAAMAEKLRKALDTPIKVDFENKTPADILKEFQAALGGVPIRIRTDLKVLAQPLTLKLSDPVSLGAAFQLLEDETKQLQFLVREYGIIILHLHQEEPPPGAEGLIDFWKGVPRRGRSLFGGGSGRP